MVEFARYYINFIRKFFQDISNFFSTIVKAFADLIFKNTRENYDIFIEASESYSALDWVIGFIVILMNLIFIGFLLMKLFQLLGKYIRFVKTEIEKAELIQEVAVLSKRTKEIIEEKNRILALQVANLGKTPQEIEDEIQEQGVKDLLDEPEKEEDEGIDSRFVKLTKVDMKYNYQKEKLFMTEDDYLSLEEMTTRFITFPLHN